MQTTEVEYVDSEIIVNEEEPSTMDELIALIGEEACIENINANLRYRNKYPRVYKKTSAALDANGNKRPQKIKDGQPVVKTAKDGTTTPVLVDPMEHLRQIIASGDDGKKLVADTLGPIAQSEPMFVKGERAGGGGKISQAALDASNAKFATGDDGAVEKAIVVIESRVPGYKVARDSDGSATPESLARGISALQKHLQAQAVKDAKGLLG